jgi:TonB family protein
LFIGNTCCWEECVSVATPKHWIRAGFLGLLVSLAGASIFGQSAFPAADQLARKVKSRVEPTYPDVARRMNITGTVKVAVVVTPSGAVKSTKVVGGHPLLVNAAVEAVKQWKFEPASQEDAGIVEFKFQPEK